MGISATHLIPQAANNQMILDIFQTVLCAECPGRGRGWAVFVVLGCHTQLSEKSKDFLYRNHIVFSKYLFICRLLHNKSLRDCNLSQQVCAADAAAVVGAAINELRSFFCGCVSLAGCPAARCLHCWRHFSTLHTIRKCRETVHSVLRHSSFPATFVQTSV